jgi:methyl-accepting chemotaxis protein
MVDRLDGIVRSSGDLTQTINIHTNDEIEVLADKTNLLLQNISQIVKSIHTITLNINKNSSETSVSFENTSQSFHTITKSIEGIVEGISEQVGAIHESTNKIESLSEHVNDLSSNSSEISVAAQNAIRFSDIGTQAISDLKEKFRVSGEIIEMASQTIMELEKKSDQIVNITEVIQNISSETNLLAFNSAIEASRAGEQGKGFAVVADEIRKLAVNTTISAKEISSHISEVRNQSIETAEAMLKVIDTMNGQSESFENANSILEQITSVVGSISTSLVNIDYAVKKVFSEKEEALSLIRDTQHASDNMVSASEEVNAAAEEQYAIISDISNRMQHLKEVSIELENTVSRFKV